MAAPGEESITRFCFGTEQEYAPVALMRDGHARIIDNQQLFFSIAHEIRRAGIPYLEAYNGIFLPYGNLYLESVGKKVEAAVAPASSPFEAVILDEKFKHILMDALQCCRRYMPWVTLLRNNRDYISGESYGSHESYAIRRTPAEIQDAVIPFLVTRQLFAGSGTLQGREYWLSPRAPFMVKATGGGTTADRAIFSTCREEPLMRNPNFPCRLHLIVGDGLMSQFGQCLKLGTTALVLRAAEEDPSIGAPVRFGAPVSALKTLSKVLNEKTPCVNSTLLFIQRHYLRAVEKMLDAHDFPPWCAQIWQWWSEVIHALESDPMSMSHRLDAYIKLKYFNYVLERTGAAWSDIQPPDASQPGNDLYWAMAFQDVCYHSIMDGTFQFLDREGALNHAILQANEILPGCEPEPYVSQNGLPREITRTRMIKEHSGDANYVCNWGNILDKESNRQFVMDDPFSFSCISRLFPARTHSQLLRTLVEQSRQNEDIPF